MKRFFSALLSLVMAISLLAYLPIQVEAVSLSQTVYTDYQIESGTVYWKEETKNGVVVKSRNKKFNARKYLKNNATFNYRAWSQDQLPWGIYNLGNNSDDSSFGAYGCLVTSFAKIAVQSGNYTIYNMDPGIMNELILKIGCFQSNNGNCTKFKTIAKTIGMEYSEYRQAAFNGDYNKAKDIIVSKLKADSNIQFILEITNNTGGPHYVPVNNEKTLYYEDIYIDDSGIFGNCESLAAYEKANVGKSFKQKGFSLTGRIMMFNVIGPGTPIESEKPGTPKVTIEFNKTSTVGITGDTWLYPAFKIQVPGYANSKITTVGYTVKTEGGKEIYKFEETYNKGVNKDGEPYTYFGDRTDGKANMDLAKDVYNIKRNYLTDVRIEPGQKYKVRGFVVYNGKPYESTEYTMSTTGTKINVTIEPYSNKTAGTTGDKWLYPAFKVTVPNYRNSGITTVGYTVTTIFDEEMFRFEETYRSGVNKDGTSYKNTFFGARTDGGANMDLEKDVYNVKREYLTDLKFISGHLYKVTGFVVFDGKRYESPDYVVMKTTGELNCAWSDEKVISKGSCTEDGQTERYCRTCGAIETTWSFAKGHKWNSGSMTKQPTCIATGEKTYTCLTCGETKTESIAPKGHTLGAAATCTSPQKCTVCGTQLKAPLGHNYSGNFWYASHPHEQYQKCTRCNAEKKTGSTKKVDSCSICCPTFTITYNANGGSGAPASQTKSSGKALTLSSTKPTKQGYTFLGWATSSGASSAQYNAGGSFTTDANTTLYAVWRKDAVVVSDVNFELSSANAVPGSTVELTLQVAGTTKVDLLTVYNIVYDKSVLEFQGVSEYGDLVKKCALPDNAFDGSNMSFTMGYADSTIASGTIAVLKFKVKDNAPEKDIIISYEAVVTKDRQPVESSVKNSVISISRWMSGDFNEDGKINMKDAVYFIGWVGAPFLPQYQINHSFDADFNKDGKITMKDAVYFIGWVGAPFLPQYKIDW